jgi:hypothetical protein
MNSPSTLKNIELAFEVAHQLVANPILIDEVMELAGEGTLVLYDDADEALTIANDRIAATLDQRGEPVVRVALQRRTTLSRR